VGISHDEMLWQRQDLSAAMAHGALASGIDAGEVNWLRDQGSHDAALKIDEPRATSMSGFVRPQQLDIPSP
jgi:hypothetical protein